MEGTRTKAEVIIPAAQQDFKVFEISFFPQRKMVRVKMIVNKATLPEEKILDVDISNEWAALSSSRKSNWRSMFKTIVAKAVGVAASAIEGEIWD